ncbi:MAG: outer membrane beta-barrel protein [Bacteroidetes bacterium]|nr:outer membrane beta-barrel protein [Bacteroidota bacterium]
MKIRSIILFALLPMLGIAQRNANLEFATGLNFTDYSNKIANTNGHLNYDFGLAMAFPLKNPKRELVAGIRFMGYGDKIESNNLRYGSMFDTTTGEFNPNLPSGEKINSLTFKHSYYYLEIPIGIRQYLTNGNSRLFIQAAVGPSYFLSGRNVSTYGFRTGGSQTGVNQDNSSSFHTVNFMADMGFGFEISVSQKLGIQCQAHAQTQLLDVVSNSETHAKWYAAGLRAGFRYRLF